MDHRPFPQEAVDPEQHAEHAQGPKQAGTRDIHRLFLGIHRKLRVIGKAKRPEKEPEGPGQTEQLSAKAHS